MTIFLSLPSPTIGLHKCKQWKQGLWQGLLSIPPNSFYRKKPSSHPLARTGVLFRCWEVSTYPWNSLGALMVALVGAEGTGVAFKIFLTSFCDVGWISSFLFDSCGGCISSCFFKTLLLSSNFFHI